MSNLSAIAKWPDVPACYEWLSLDQRGAWRLQGERVTHHGLNEFLNKNYASDDSGCWFVQNGPQRVYVDLDCTPWIFRIDSGVTFTSHTGHAAGKLKAIYLDSDGRLFLDTELGIGLLDDRDLSQVWEQCIDAHGQPADEACFHQLLSGAAPGVFLGGVSIKFLGSTEPAKHFAFIKQPRLMKSA